MIISSLLGVGRSGALAGPNLMRLNARRFEFLKSEGMGPLASDQ